ncbi:SPOR domain-containing protein [Pseudomonadales bacterium]|nr:SPOR domain-containing protein [Pseudomonadales bacterium]MDB4068763.1 SPOR domain-containing protein [Pseudomonadales bacterium]
MRTFILCSLLCLVTTDLRADFDSATEAYQQRDYITAFAEFSSLADAGDPRAQTILALMHRFGEGTTEDLNQAFNWYTRAATAGYPPAQYYLANLYADGSGTAVDIGQALSWLRQSAAGGFERANARLATLTNSPEPASDEERSEPSRTTDWNFRLPNQSRNHTAMTHTVAPVEPGYRVQLGAFRSSAAAINFWATLEQQRPDLFSDLHSFVETIYLQQRLIYRLQVGHFEDLGAIDKFCRALVDANIESGCLGLNP